MKKNQLNKKIIRKTGLPRLLIVGCGDIGLRILPLLRGQLVDDGRCGQARYRIFALTTQASRCDALRAAGAIPIVGNLDQPHTLARLAGLAAQIIYLAPPPATGQIDTRSRHLAAVLNRRCKLVYVSTSGVYGDCGGDEIDETRPVLPRNLRAVRRVDAEQVWRRWALRTGSTLSIVRVPGIYAGDRLPIERLKQGTPALQTEQDVYTNHIHALDLAKLVVRALGQGSPNRIYHAVDDTEMKMGDYFDLVADHFNLPRPPRLPRLELEKQVSPMLLSFMSESRRMKNARIKHELGYRLLFPQVAAGLEQN
jgi:nucleoside-diphosphate-sugar epimerase